MLRYILGFLTIALGTILILMSPLSLLGCILSEAGGTMLFIFFFVGGLILVAIGRWLMIKAVR